MDQPLSHKHEHIIDFRHPNTCQTYDIFTDEKLQERPFVRVSPPGHPQPSANVRNPKWGNYFENAGTTATHRNLSIVF